MNNKEFRFFLIGLNNIFSTLPQSEYTSRAVSTPHVKYIRACVYFCLLSIRCFNVIQPETRFHFQLANQIAKKGQNFQKFQIFKNFKFSKISKFYKILQNFKNWISKNLNFFFFLNQNVHKILKLKNFVIFQNFHRISKF